jgi:hypothetical protein
VVNSFKMFSDEIENRLLAFAESEGCYKEDIEIYVFPQVWSSTALGYGGIGGQAITSSHTIVFYNTTTDNALLSYGRTFIKIEKPNRLFMDDIFNHSIEPAYKLGKYKRDQI